MYGGKCYFDHLLDADRSACLEVESQPSVYDLIQGWLERMPFVGSSDASDGYSFLDVFKRSVARHYDMQAELMGEEGGSDKVASN